MRDSRSRRWFSAPRPLRRAAREQLDRQRRRRMLLEPLECRHLLAGDFFVNDNWHFETDADDSGTLTVGDLVNNNNDSAGATITKTYGVDAYGSVTSGAETGSLAAFNSIQDAIDDAAAGEEVVILQGTYVENLTIAAAKNGLVLSGHTGAASEVVIDGNAADVITVLAADVEIRHLRVTDGLAGIFVDGGNNFTATNVTADANDASGLLASGIADVSIAGGQYVDNGASGIELVDFTGTATIDGTTASDNAAVGIAAINAASAGTLELLNVSLSGNATGGGDIQQVSSVDFTTTAPAGTVDEIVLTDSDLTHTRGGVLQQSIAYADVTQFDIFTLGGQDVLTIVSTAAGTSYDVDAGDQNDTVHIGDPTAGSRSIDAILGPVTIHGGNNEATPTSDVGPIQGDSNPLAVGDTLAVHDEDSASGATYELSASTFERSGTASVTYNTTETVTLAAAAAGGSTISVNSTVANGTTTITGGTGVDEIDVTATGAGSNVSVNGGGGADPITINTTGAGGFLVVNSNAGGDVVILKNTGANSRVQLNGGAGRDQLDVWATASGSKTEIFAGADNDTVNLGDTAVGQRTVDDIDGIVVVNGGAHEAGITSSLGPIQGETNTLVAGDALSIHDQDSAGGIYDLSNSTFQRSGTALVTYSETETVDLAAATAGGNTINVTSTVGSGSTSVTGGNNVDSVNVTTTGADSNVTINAGTGSDPVTVNTTGAQSFLVVNGGDEGVATGDTLVLKNTGADSRVRLAGGAGRDAIEIWATAAGSESDVFGGSENDTIDIGNPDAGQRTLENVDGIIDVRGEAHETGAAAATHAAIAILGDSSGELFVGDTLNLNDQDSAASSAYSLGAATFSRTGTGVVTYGTTETVNLGAAANQANVINAAGTIAGGTTTIAAGAQLDQVTVATTGSDSNVTIRADEELDEITIQHTGADGGDANNASGDNPLGSFVVIEGGDEAAASGDLIVIENTEPNSRLRIEGDGGRDTIEIWATDFTSEVEIFGGEGNDVIHVGNPDPGQRDLEPIDGPIVVRGENHEILAGNPKHAAIDILGDSSGQLFVGDTLNFNDQDSASASTFSLADATFSRTGTATVSYFTTETVNLNAAQSQANIINVATVVSGGTTTINGGSLIDTVVFATTGADSSLLVNTAAGDDLVRLQNTGGDATDDNNADGNNDLGSFVVVNSGSNRDTVEAWATSQSSRTQVLAGDHNDTIHLGNPVAGQRRVQDIDGRIDVDGQAHEVGAGPTHAAVAILGDSSGELFVGDTLHVNDQDEAGSQTHSLSASTYGRSGAANNQYGNLETVNLASASSQPSTVAVASTVAGGTTNLIAGSAADTINVTTTGADSNVAISTLSAADEITLASTGADGADNNNAAGDNSLGSFAVASGGDESDIIILQSNGVASRTHLMGEQGGDTLEMWATSFFSRTLAQGQDDDDTFGIANGDLSAIQAAPNVEGGEGSESARADVRRGGTVNAVAPFFTAATENVGLADKLFLRDAAATGTQTYGINSTLASRGGETKVEHSQLEQIHLTAGTGNDDVTADFDPTADETQRVNCIQVDGGLGSDNRLQVQGTSGTDEISLRDMGEDIGAMFEMNRVQRLWVRGEDGLDTIDNQSSVFGLIDGGIGDDRLHSIVSTPSDLNSFGQVRNSVLLAGPGQDALMVGATPIETQRVGITSTSDVTGGTFTLTFQGQTTAPIAASATAAAVQAALVALNNIGPSDISVSQVENSATARVWQIKFSGAYQSVNVDQVTIDASAVTSAGIKSEVQLTSADTADRGSTYLVGDHAVNPNAPPAMIKTVTPLDRYMSSASVAQQSNNCNDPQQAGQHTILAASSTPPDTVQGPFTTITATKIKLSVINWLQACLTLDVTQKGNLAQEARVNNQVAEFLAMPTTASGGPPPGEPESDAPITVPLNPFHNPFQSTDVNDDGKVSPSDALAIINQLNAGRGGPLSLPPSAEGEDGGIGELAAADAMWFLYDVNDDGMLSPSDALAVINQLNASISASSAIHAEGEAGDDAETLFALLAEDWHQQQKRRGM